MADAAGSAGGGQRFVQGAVVRGCWALPRTTAPWTKRLAWLGSFTRRP